MWILYVDRSLLFRNTSMKRLCETYISENHLLHSQVPLFPRMLRNFRCNVGVLRELRNSSQNSSIHPVNKWMNWWSEDMKSFGINNSLWLSSVCFNNTLFRTKRQEQIALLLEVLHLSEHLEWPLHCVRSNSDFHSKLFKFHYGIIEQSTNRCFLWV